MAAPDHTPTDQLSERHRADLDAQAQWTSRAMKRDDWRTLTVGLLPSDGTNYEVVLSERIAPDGRRGPGIIVSLLRAGSAAYVWHPGGYVDPLYVEDSWRIHNRHTATILAYFLTRLGELVGREGIEPSEPMFVDARKYRVLEEMRAKDCDALELVQGQRQQLLDAAQAFAWSALQDHYRSSRARPAETSLGCQWAISHLRELEAIGGRPDPRAVVEIGNEHLWEIVYGPDASGSPEPTTTGGDE